MLCTSFWPKSHPAFSGTVGKASSSCHQVPKGRSHICSPLCLLPCHLLGTCNQDKVVWGTVESLQNSFTKQWTVFKQQKEFTREVMFQLIIKFQKLWGQKLLTIADSFPLHHQGWPCVLQITALYLKCCLVQLTKKPKKRE